MKKLVRFLYCAFTAFFIIATVYNFLAGVSIQSPYYISLSIFFLNMAILGYCNIEDEKSRDRDNKV